MHYLCLLLLLGLSLGLSKNSVAEIAEPVQIPGYTAPNFSVKSAPSPSNEQSKTPAAATTNPQETASVSPPPQEQTFDKFLIAIRQCVPQSRFDLGAVLSSLPKADLSKLLGNNTVKIEILGPSEKNCHIVTTMISPALLTQKQPNTMAFDCLVTPNVTADFITVSKLILQENQAGKPMQLGTQQLFFNWTQEFLTTCKMTFNGKAITLPSSNAATGAPNMTSQPVPQNVAPQSQNVAPQSQNVAPQPQKVAPQP